MTEADGVDRDRDPNGRPRNARPRDAAGRPLPRGAKGVEPVPDDVTWSIDGGLAEAQRLLDAGRPFAAHEVVEALWKQTDDPARRPVWRGLAQLLVGLTHRQRGNLAGASVLLRRGTATLVDADPAVATGLGIDARAWTDWATIAAATPADVQVPPPPRLAASA